MNDRLRSRRWILRGITAVLVLALLTPASASYVSNSNTDASALNRGTVTSPANGSTVVSVQGYTFGGNTNPKKPARLISAGERGHTEWIYNSSRGEDAWFFDVDPLPNGNLLVVSPREGRTLVYELDPETKERVWKERLPYVDTHDVDMLSEDELLVSNMRQWNETAKRSDDRIVIYNLTTDSVTWEWYYREHFPRDTNGGHNDDWTHSNDVDVIGPDRFLLSPRNFDQVLIVNRTTGLIENRLGETGNHSILKEQHNPDYLVGEDGTPTLLVADSGNNRIVEYAYTNGTWTRTWNVGSDTLNWPRDADRLPNGNTLVTDTLNHRVMEITPNGTVVWEYYATWGPYDAERVAHGDGSTNGPTVRDLNATGTYSINGSANLTAGSNQSVAFQDYITATFAGTPLQGTLTKVSTVWGHYAPWIRPVWMSGWDFVFAILGGVVLLGWLLAELAHGAYLGVRRYRGRRPGPGV
jgi:hypothetical protein